MKQRISLYPLSEFSGVKLTGRDARKFLNNFCTANLISPPYQSVQELMVLNAKGHVLAWGWAFELADGLGLLTTGLNAADLCQHLDTYLFSEDVVLSVWPVDFWWMENPDSGQPESQNLKMLEVEAPSPVFEKQPEFSVDADWQIWQVAGGNYIGFGPPRSATDVNVDKTSSLELANRVFRQVLPNDRVSQESQFVSEPDEFQRWRITQRLPLVGQDTVATTLPQELLRNDLAICFTKGCYLGQETVARLDAMGHVNWNLRLVILQQNWPRELTDPRTAKPAHQVDICHDNDVIGQLTSVWGNVGLVRIRATWPAKFGETGIDWRLKTELKGLDQIRIIDLRQ